jgi:hypothetical protein
MLARLSAVGSGVLLALALAGATHAESRTQAVAGGVGMLRLGDSASIGSAHFSHSAYVIVSPFNARLVPQIRAGNAATKVLAYKASMDLKSSPFCAAHGDQCETGISYAEAVAHDAANPKDPWILRDASGSPMTGGYPDNFLGDVGSKSFQSRWIANVSSFLQANHFSGVFIDNVLGDVSGWTKGRYPAKYPTDAAWSDAMASFVKQVSAVFRPRDLFVAVNAYKPYPENTSWWKRIAPSTDALMSEYWQQNPNNPRELYTADAPSWTGHWDYWQKLIDIAQDAGSAFFGLQYGDASDTRLMRYGRASFLLDWNGKRGAYFFNPQSSADPWQGAWTADIGRPLADRFRVGTGWRRDYSGGTVILNPSASRSQTFDLGRPYTLPDGTTARSITLAPSTALVLTGIQQSSSAPAAQRPSAAVSHGATAVRWDGKLFRTRRQFNGWLRSHHLSWNRWAERHPVAAHRLS